MEDILEIQSFIGSENMRMANMVDRQTCAASSLNLIMASVLFMHTQMIKVVGDMVCRARISIPVHINAIGGSRSKGHNMLLLHRMYA